MNKLLVTGMAIGKDAGVCDACNYDFDWLLTHPSVLLWADKIIVTKTVWDVVQEEYWPNPKSVAKCCKLILEMANAHGMIEVTEPTPVLDNGFADAVTSQVEKDVQRIRSVFADKVEVCNLGTADEEGPEAIRLDGVHYCTPYLSSIYTSLMLAKAWNAYCLFDDEALNLLRYKFGISRMHGQVRPDITQSFATVFEAYFPNDQLFPHYAFGSDGKCKECGHLASCKDTYLRDVEGHVQNLLTWRDYDEVQETRAVVEKIIATSGSNEDAVNPQQVATEFESRKRTMARRMQSVFPKVKRWSNVATLVSVPVAVIGLSAGASSLTLAGAATAGMAQIGKEYIEYMESKHRWVGFLQNLRST